MKTKTFSLLRFFLLPVLVIGCSGGDDSPVNNGNDTDIDNEIINITTVSATDITVNSATLHGTFIYVGTETVTEKGMVYGTEEGPTYQNDEIAAYTGTAPVMTVTITALEQNTTYYARSFAIIGGETHYGNEIEFTTEEEVVVLPEYEIGDIGPGGGYIFYLDGNGHGLEVAPASTHFETQWGCYSTNISGTQSGLGTGQANTNIILDYHESIGFYDDPEQCQEYVAPVGIIASTGDVAAKKCADLVYGGKSDWYLPSIDEANLIYENLYLTGLGDVQDVYGLITSTQDPEDYKSIMSVNFDDGSIWGYWKHDLGDYRAIRSF